MGYEANLCFVAALAHFAEIRLKLHESCNAVYSFPAYNECNMLVKY